VVYKRLWVEGEGKIIVIGDSEMAFGEKENLFVFDF